MPEPRAELGALLAAIDNALRNGSYMTGANLAFEMLCDRLEFDSRWASTVPDEASWMLQLVPDGARICDEYGTHNGVREHRRVITTPWTVEEVTDA